MTLTVAVISVPHSPNLNKNLTLSRRRNPISSQTSLPSPGIGTGTAIGRTRKSGSPRRATPPLTKSKVNFRRKELSRAKVSNNAPEAATTNRVTRPEKAKTTRLGAGAHPGNKLPSLKASTSTRQSSSLRITWKGNSRRPRDREIVRGRKLQRSRTSLKRRANRSRLRVSSSSADQRRPTGAVAAAAEI